jgi:hypothetical protein
MTNVTRHPEAAAFDPWLDGVHVYVHAVSMTIITRM